MTKAEHISELRNVHGLTNDRVHYKVAEMALDAAYRQLMAQVPREEMHRASREYLVNAYEDTDHEDMWIANLPNGMIEITGGAVLEVRSIYDDEAIFIMSTKRDATLTKGLLCDSFSSAIEYDIYENQIVFRKLPSGLANGVNVRMVPSFSTHTDSQEVFLPSGQEYSMQQLALDFMNQTPIMDLKDDNNGN